MGVVSPAAAISWVVITRSERPIRMVMMSIADDESLAEYGENQILYCRHAASACGNTELPSACQGGDGDIICAVHALPSTASPYNLHFKEIWQSCIRNTAYSRLKVHNTEKQILHNNGHTKRMTVSSWSHEWTYPIVKWILKMKSNVVYYFNREEIPDHNLQVEILSI